MLMQPWNDFDIIGQKRGCFYGIAFYIDFLDFDDHHLADHSLADRFSEETEIRSKHQ